MEREQEFQEQERLRQEVANLESSIQPGVVVNRDLLKQKARDSDSSATDASGDETAEEDMPQDESSGDALKKQLLERLALKQAEEERKLAESSKPTSPTVAKQKQSENKVSTNEDEEMDDGEEEVDDAVDMFAESSDEKEEKNDKIKETIVAAAATEEVTSTCLLYTSPSPRDRG